MYFQFNEIDKIKKFYSSFGYVIIKNFLDKDYIASLKKKNFRKNKYLR